MIKNSLNILRKIGLIVLVCSLLPFAASADELSQGEYMFEDDCTTLDKIYEKSGIMDEINTTKYNRSVYGMAKDTKTGYAVYKLDGDITSFEVFAMLEGSDRLSRLETYVYVSPDNVNYTQIDAPLIWGSSYGEPVTVNGGYPVKYKSDSIPEGMRYLKIVPPEIKDGLTSTYDNYNRSIYRVKIGWFNKKFAASTGKTVKAENTLKVSFSEEVNPDTVTADAFEIENGPAVTAAQLLEDMRTCILTLAGSLEGSSTYRLNISDTITSAEGYPLSHGKTIEFETEISAGVHTFKDDCTTLDKIYEKSEGLHLAANVYDSPVYYAAAGTKAPYSIYKTDGEMISFSVETVIHGAGVYKNGYYFDFYVSPDGVEYTKLALGTDFGETSRSDGVTTYALRVTNASKEGRVPSGMKYLKIKFPELKDGETDYNYQRSVANVEIEYAIHSAGIYKSRCGYEIKDSGTAEFYIDLGIVNDLENNLLNPEYVSLEDGGACISSDYIENEKCYRLYFDRKLGFGSSCVLVLSEEIKDIYGFSIAAEARRTEIKTPPVPQSVEVTENVCKYSGVMDIGKLMNGKITRCVKIKGIYFNEERSKSVCVISVLYSGDRIKEVKTVTKDINVGTETEFRAEHIVTDENTRLEVFITDGILTRVPIADSAATERE